VPILGLYGGNDDGIPVATVEQMRKALKAGAILRPLSFTQTRHAFLPTTAPPTGKTSRRRLETPTGLVQAAWG